MASTFSNRLLAVREQLELKEQFPWAFKMAHRRWPGLATTLDKDGFELLSLEPVEGRCIATIRHKQTHQTYTGVVHRFLGRLHAAFTLDQNKEPVTYYFK